MKYKIESVFMPELIFRYEIQSAKTVYHFSYYTYLFYVEQEVLNKTHAIIFCRPVDFCGQFLFFCTFFYLIQIRYSAHYYVVWTLKGNEPIVHIIFNKCSSNKEYRSQGMVKRRPDKKDARRRPNDAARRPKTPQVTPEIFIETHKDVPSNALKTP